MFAPVPTREVRPVSTPGRHQAPAITHWWRVFPGDASQLRVMRRWLEDLLPACPARDDVIDVADELAGNAIRHTRSGCGGEFGIRLEPMPGLIRVTVADRGGATGPHLVSDPLGENGRGLRIVQALSAQVDVSGGTSGRLVRADVPWAEATTPEMSSAEGLAMLGNLFPGLLVWFGNATRQWWAVVATEGADRLVGAQSSWELAALAGTMTARPGGRTG